MALFPTKLMFINLQEPHVVAYFAIETYLNVTSKNN